MLSLFKSKSFVDFFYCPAAIQNIDLPAIDAHVSYQRTIRPQGSV